MESGNYYTFRLSIERNKDTVLAIAITADTDDCQKAKKIVQKLLSDFAPGTKKPEQKRAAPDLPGTAPEIEVERSESLLPSEAAQTPQERGAGIRGIIQLRCDKCGNKFGTFLAKKQTEFKCRCGHSIDLTTPMARFEYTCPCCEAKLFGLTNMEEPDITVKCKCGSPIDMQWVPKIREYRN